MLFILISDLLCFLLLVLPDIIDYKIEIENVKRYAFVEKQMV